MCSSTNCCVAPQTPDSTIDLCFTPIFAVLRCTCVMPLNSAWLIYKGHEAAVLNRSKIVSHVRRGSICDTTWDCTTCMLQAKGKLYQQGQSQYILNLKLHHVATQLTMCIVHHKVDCLHRVSACFNSLHAFQVLAADVNIGYEEMVNTRVQKVNGKQVKNLLELVTLIGGCKEEFLRLDLEYNQVSGHVCHFC